MWNFLDNAKLHVEDPEAAADVSKVVSHASNVNINLDVTNADPLAPSTGTNTGTDTDGGEGDAAATAAAAVDAAAAEGARINPGGDDWESFGGADGTGVEQGREANGFDWVAWEAFAARSAGDRNDPEP
jgi:hypothetical protein